MTDPAALVYLEGLEVRFGLTEVLRGLNLTVGAGTSVGVIGPNGSGKTTLLRALATLIRPTGGRGRVLGASLGSDEVYGIRSSIELLGHRPALYPDLTLEENLAFVARLSGISGDLVHQTLQIVGLGRVSGRRGADASWGMQRRAEFGRIFLTAPRLLLLDEPYVGLDADASELVRASVDRTVREGGVAILASHRAESLTDVSDRLFSLGGGTLEVIREVRL